MKLFYKNIQSGMPKDQALQQAKLIYLDNQNDPLDTHPFYWAAFVVVGDMEPILLSRKHPWLWTIAGALLFVLTYLIWSRLK